jgi:hypothetical protein
VGNAKAAEVAAVVSSSRGLIYKCDSQVSSPGGAIQCVNVGERAVV